MCQTKEEAKSKIDKLVQALDRHTDAIERLLAAEPSQHRLKGQAGGLGRGPCASGARA